MKRADMVTARRRKQRKKNIQRERRERARTNRYGRYEGVAEFFLLDRATLDACAAAMFEPMSAFKKRRRKK